jgi:hypothetical protein
MTATIRSCVRSARATAGVLLLLVLSLVLAGCGARPGIPEALAGLTRTHAEEGGEALASITRLHGKAVRARDGFVAHYEGDGGVAMLYVTRAWVTPLATWQISRMAEGIERGRANAEGRFTHLRSREQDGVTLYSALGLGQVHYFYRSGATVVWLAADARVARQALADTLRLVR